MDSASLTQPSQNDDAELKELLTNDSKFRNYAGQLEKALRSFESTAEWADLIAALGRLIKVLKENSKYSVIPHKLVLGRRLAQCMHPALPAGVHLKAIETYEMVFRATGKARLAQDLAVYGSGLFPLFPNAATNVKPVLIDLYENYLVRLGCGMRVALSGIVLGLLQALEVINEHTERVSLLLDSIRDAVGRECFYTTLYRVVLNSPTIRFPALSYVLNNFDKRKTVSTQRELLGDDVRMSISALCAALQDQNSLVQRTALDVIGTFFPLHVQTQELEATRNRPESEGESGCDLVLSESEITRLMIAALQIVLRRDTSLNRRLYAWLLGTSAVQVKPAPGSSDLPTPPARNRSQSVFDLTTAPADEDTGAAAALVVGEQYFVRFTKDRVIRAFRAILAASALQSGLLARQSATHANYATLLEAILGPSVPISPAESLQSAALSQLVSLSVNQFGRPTGKDAGSWLPCECASVELTLPAIIKPLRILISLLDKAEVSTNLLDELLLDVCSYWFELVRATQMASPRERRVDLRLTELAKIAQLFFTQLDPDYIWQLLLDSFDQLFSRVAPTSEHCRSATEAESGAETDDCSDERKPRRNSLSDVIKGARHSADVSNWLQHSVQLAAPDSDSDSRTGAQLRPTSEPVAAWLKASASEIRTCQLQEQLDKAVRFASVLQFLVDNVSIERETRDLLLPKLLTKLANWLDRLLIVLDREHLETLLRFAVSLLRRIAKDGCVFELDSEAFLAASTDSETAFCPDSMQSTDTVPQDTPDRSSQLRSQQQKPSAGRPAKAKLVPTGDYGSSRQPDAIARSRSAAHLVAALTRVRNVLGALGEAKLGLNATLRQRAVRYFSAPTYAPPDRLVAFLSTILANHQFVATVELDAEDQHCSSSQGREKQATINQRWYLNNRVQLPKIVLPAHATEYRECFALLCSFLIEFAALPFSVTLTDDVRAAETKSTLISTLSSSSASDAKRNALTEFFSSAFQFGLSSSSRSTAAAVTVTATTSSNSSLTASSSTPTLSNWLETLLIGACFVNDETLRFEAIKTVVELVSIAQSASMASSSATSASATTKTSIVFLAMPSAMLSMLQSRTSFLFVCALTLLDDFRPTIAVLNAPIALAYHRIWQLSPPSLRRVGDDLLSASIIGCAPSRRLALLERFFVFYTVSNNHTSLPALALSGRPGVAADQANARVPGPSSQASCAFARTVLLVLDSLLDDSAPSLRASVQNWLLDLLRRSAFAPVFELVLLLLLDADTARVADESYAARSGCAEKMDARLRELSNESTQLLNAMRTDRFRKAPEPVKSEQVEWPPVEPSVCAAPESVDSDLDLSDGEPADSVVSDILEEVIVKAVVSAEGEKPGSRAARDIPPAAALQLAVTSGDVHQHTNVSVSEDNFEFTSTVDNPHQADQFPAATHATDVIDSATRASACSFRLPLPNGVVRKLEHHLLYYTQRYDVARVAHALRLLSSLTTVCGADQLLRFLLRSHIGKSPCTLRVLLTRHRVASLGGNFNAHVSQSDSAAFAKQLVYAEVLLTVLLDLLRAELKPVVLDVPHVSLTDTLGNRDVQLRVLDVMFSLLTELEERPIAPYRHQRAETIDLDDSDLSALRSLFETCQLQKLLLRTLLRSVLIPANSVANDDETSFFYTAQLKVLRIFGTLVRLEARLYTADAYTLPPLIHAGSVTALTMLDYRSNSPLLIQPSLYYLMHTVFNVPANCKLGSQTALAHRRMQIVHKHWYTFVSDSLSVMSHTLPYFLHLTVNAACRNLESLLDQKPPTASTVLWSTAASTPADYVYSAIDHLLVTARYALTSKFDREAAKFMQLVAPSDADKLLDATSAGSGVTDGAASVQQGTTGFFSSLFQSAKTVLNPLSSDEITVQRARRILLRSLLSTLRCCVQLWAGLGDEQLAGSASASLKLGPAWLCDRPKTLQGLLLAYLSLFCRTESYMQMLLYACARLWTAENRRDAVQLSSNLSTNLALFDASFVGRLTVLQRAVIDILHKLKDVTFESLTATLRELLSSPIIRKPVSSNAANVGSVSAESVLTRGGIVNTIEVCLLQLFVAFFKRFDVVTVVQYRARFFWFVRECLAVRVAPHATFMLLRTVFDFANAHGGAQLQALIDDKREYRELQDCVLKCLEQVALAAGFSLEEASAFFKRNVTVRTTGGSQSEPPAIAGGNADIASIVNGDGGVNAPEDKDKDKDAQPDKIGSLALAASASAAVMTIQENNLYSAQALILLGEMLTPLLDLAFRSDEKERTVTFLGPVLQFIFPYLRQHSHGTRHFSKFAVKLMASLSSFQYTRKAWRKEMLDMFMDPAFFQIEPTALRYWIATVDNLLTQDRNTFKEFLSRLSAAATTVNSSITIFVNRESELMQYATLLKRLSFAIFCSERDQYSKQLGDIQDRLKESLRTQSIMLQLNVFNCFRVLLLRVSASNLANLWPLFITELQQALSALEADLLRICNERETQLSTANEYTRNLIVPLSSSIWLDAVRRAHYLVTLKLALMMLLLPEDYVPHFMPVRWLFVDDTTGNSRPPIVQPKITEVTSKKPPKPESSLTASAKANDIPFKLSLSKSTDVLFGLTKSTDSSAETTRRSDSPPPTSSSCSAILNRVYGHIQRIAHAHTSRASSRNSQLNGVGSKRFSETNLTALWAKAQNVLEQRTFNAFDELETLVTLCLHASRFGAEFYASHAHASAFFGKVRYLQFEDTSIAVDADSDAPKTLGQAESVGYAFGGAAPTPVFFAGTGVNPTSLNMLLVYFEHLLKLDFIEPVAS